MSIVRGRTEGNFDHRFVLRKADHRILLEFDHWLVFRDDRAFNVFCDRPAVLIDLFARTSPEITEALADISDGSSSGNGILSFCSAAPEAILIPDSDFYGSGGYASVRALATADGPDWSDRDPTIVWRGGTTGRGVIALEDMRSDDPRLIPRTRLCVALRGQPGLDVKLHHVVQSSNAIGDFARLRAAGIFGERIDVSAWRRRKFAIDIDGNSNSWSNLFTRLLLGCCVIKVGSQQGYRQWYYDALRPFEHFVPVAPDLSDLAEKLEWCRGHDRECAAIAAAGREFALGRTLESELSAAIERVNRALTERRR